MSWANDFFILLNKTIVIIDSDPLLLEVLAIALSHEGYKMSSTPDYDNVLELVKQHQPAMVIIEYRLKRNEAKLLCKQLRNYNEQLILLALSSSINMESIYVSEGFDGFIPKPFELDHLFGTINSFLR